MAAAPSESSAEYAGGGQVPDRVGEQHHGAGAARLRQKQALDLIALRTELFECVIADAAMMPVEKA